MGRRWVLAGLSAILVLSGAVTALSERSTSWSGNVRIEGQVTVPPGEALIVQPGSEISSAGPDDALLVVDGSLLLEGSGSSPIRVRVPIHAGFGNDSSIFVRNTSFHPTGAEGCAVTLSPYQPARIENSTIGGAERGLCVQSPPRRFSERDHQVVSAPSDDASSTERSLPVYSVAELETIPTRTVGPESPAPHQWEGVHLDRLHLIQNEGVGFNLSSADSLPTRSPPVQARHLNVEENGIGIRTVEGAPRLEVWQSSIADNRIGAQTSGGHISFDHATFENNEEWDVLQLQGSGNVQFTGSSFASSCAHMDARETYGCHRGAIDNVTVQTIVIGLLYGLVYLLSEAGHYLLVRIGLALRLYSRIPRDELLEDETRALLLEMVRATPGRHLRELVRETGEGYGTVVYHLERLENEGFVNSQREGLYRRFYASDADPEERAPRDTRERVLDAIENEPGIHAAEIARKLDTSRQSVSYHVRELVDGARIEERPAETRKRLFPLETP